MLSPDGGLLRAGGPLDLRSPPPSPLSLLPESLRSPPPPSPRYMGGGGATISGGGRTAMVRWPGPLLPREEREVVREPSSLAPMSDECWLRCALLAAEGGRLKPLGPMATSRRGGLLKPRSKSDTGCLSFSWPTCGREPCERT